MWGMHVLNLVYLDVSVLVSIYNTYANSLRLAAKRVVWFENAFPKQISTSFALQEFQRKKHDPELGYLNAKGGECMLTLHSMDSWTDN